jgi:hypothetical protein
MDEFGFAFEFFGPLGEYRTLDNGQPIVAAGEMPNVGSWDNAAELGAVLHDDERLPRCVVQNLIRGELGHVESTGEEPQITELVAAFADNGYSMKKLMVEMAASPLFRYVDEPK